MEYCLQHPEGELRRKNPMGWRIHLNKDTKPRIRYRICPLFADRA
jgi:hypothetical protein